MMRIWNGNGSTMYLDTMYRENWTTMEELLQYLKGQDLLEEFVQHATNKGIKRRNNLINKSRSVMEEILYGNVIYNLLGMEEYVKYLNQSDPVVLKAIEVLDRGESRPLIENKE